jgi:hypothetical protein
MKPRIYLAAAWSRKQEICDIANDLISLGHNVQSRWLYEPSFSSAVITDRKNFMRSRAEIDVEDVRAADILVRFSDNLNQETVPSRLATGARMFETGLAYSLGKVIVIVGGYQCVFDYLDSCYHVKNITELARFLNARVFEQESI